MDADPPSFTSAIDEHFKVGLAGHSNHLLPLFD
jgi:hypothetical protein